MDGTTLHLENGEIILADDRIIIQDNARKNKVVRLIFSTLGIINGIFSTWSFQDPLDSFEQGRFWIGAFIASGFVVDIVFALRKSTASEIPLNTIKQFRFRSNMMGEETLVLTLSNGLRRTIGISAPVANDLLTSFYEKGL